MDFDVVGAGIESQAGEGVEATAEGFVVGPDQDEVEVWHADVVGPDVYLFHDHQCEGRALELYPRTGSRGNHVAR